MDRYGNDAAFLCADRILWDVHERICCAFPLWDGEGVICKKDAPLHVPLGICADGIASWTACPGYDSKVEDG